ncbi:MAG: hypothetical protein RIR00_429 [Pseudomonadota bacterium]|jgi:putative N6-adenine-specific DNA methylase
MHTYFAPSPRGLEAALADELRQCGARNLQVLGGGVEFSGDLACCYRANLHSRLATRILRRVARGSYAREEDVYRLALAQRWPDFFRVERTMRVYTTATRSPLRSLDFVTLRVKDAICDRFRSRCDERPSIDTREPDVRIHVFLSEDSVSLYLDTSGAPLWQRGLRQASVEAPLKENLAAGILRLSGWEPGTPLLDPMCGSGTFLLEAALMALNIAPGSRRHFAFEQLADFDAWLWLQLREEAIRAEKPVQPLPLFGRDNDFRALRATRRNFQDAGLEPAVTLEEGDVLAAEAPAPAGMMVANPPYGERIGEAEALAALYPQLGALLKQRFAGWNCFFFTADTRLPKGLGLKPGRKTPLFNGPLECRLYEFRMVAGSNRKEKPAEPA